MNAQDPKLLLMLCLLIGCFTAAIAQSNTGTTGGPTHFTEKQLEVERKALEAIKGAEREAAAMVPGRAWTWQLRAEESRQHLGAFRRALDALRDNEASFEVSMKESKFASHFQSIREILQHVLVDAQSLDDELQKGYPARWHVVRDVSDMQSEIRQLRKVHEQISRGGSR
jgi:hypothetical protein